MGLYAAEQQSKQQQRGADMGFMMNLNGQQGGHKGKNTLYHIPAALNVVEDDMSQWENIDDVVGDDDIEDQIEAERNSGHISHELEAPGSKPVNPITEAQRALAAIPEAVTPLHTRKRRADMADQHSLKHAERIKVAHNLDSTLKLGNNATPQASFLQFSDANLVDHLTAVGISLGYTIGSINSSVAFARAVELERFEKTTKDDKISSVFDKEEKEAMQDEEVDKLILNSLWCESMDEVMDLVNAYPPACKFTPRRNSSSSPKRVQRPEESSS
jgi:hypothetical protein